MRRLIEPSHLDLRCLQKPFIIAYGSERVNDGHTQNINHKARLRWAHSSVGTGFTLPITFLCVKIFGLNY